MAGTNQQSILVIFGDRTPQKNKEWHRQFDEVIGPEKLKTFINPGSIQEAYRLVNKLSGLSKTINYKGYELWWMNYESLYDKFCLPYTQYAGLLSYLKDYKKVCFFNPPYPYLFQYFLEAHGCKFSVFKPFHLKNLLPLPAGVLIQVFLSFLFLPWLKIKRAKLMVWTSDKFSLPRDHDFRMGFIYDELRKRKIRFIEFIRGLEPWYVVLQHAIARKRPVFYSAAVTMLVYSLAKAFGKKDKIPQSSSSLSEEETFWFLTATHYLRDITAAIWAIKIIEAVLKFVGIKTAIITVATARTLHEVLGCKLAGIKTVGIQHGVPILEYCVYDFMPGFTGKKSFSVDKYGVWSDWWKEYYLSVGRAYHEEQLEVSGPMRPISIKPASSSFTPRADSLKVLFISEQLAFPNEVISYLLTVLEEKDFTLYLKFRPYRDGFELWLKQNQPEFYKKLLEKAKILRGTMEEAIGVCDVVVGSHSTAVLEALLQLKPPVFFRTQKWGDYFGMRSFNHEGRFFAENPEELVEKIRKSIDMPKEDLKKLQKRFFGDPYQNGSAWVVDEVEKFLKFSEQKQNKS
ncbi:MAG: hypothetical protein ABIB55_01530 [Candidatus Nealsonbacteria bacterium]